MNKERLKEKTHELVKDARKEAQLLENEIEYKTRCVKQRRALRIMFISTIEFVTVPKFMDGSREGIQRIWFQPPPNL